MTKKDFFRIIIKLFGLYALIMTIFNFLPINFAYTFMEFDVFALLWLIGIVTSIIFIYIFLIHKADVIINLLKLDKGFDDDHILLSDLNALAILKIAIIIISGILLIENVPSFLEYSFLAFKEEVGTKNYNTIPLIQFGSPTDYFNWILTGINIILALVIIFNYNSLANWIFSKQK